MKKPWLFEFDMNHDEIFTISDIFDWLVQLYYLPGDSVLYLLMSSFVSISQFFEITQNSFHGFFSGIISFITWLIVIVVASGLCISFIETLSKTVSDIQKYKNSLSMARKRKKLGYDKEE